MAGDLVQVPDEFFVIRTTDDPLTLGNMSLGKIASAGAARAEIEPEVYLRGRDQWFPFVPNPDFQSFVGWQMQRVTADYRVEYEAERVRCSEFPHLPARLGCLYAWGSLEDALKAGKKMRGRFRNRPVLRCTLDSPPLRIARCNSAIVSFARRVAEGHMATEDDIALMWRTYWSGSDARLSVARSSNPEGGPGVVGTPARPLWEWLIDGVLRIEGEVDLPGA